MKGTPTEMRNAPGGPKNSYDVERGFKPARGSDLAFFADISGGISTRSEW